MKNTLQPGLVFTHRTLVTSSHTVPALLPESAEFRAMPSVLATGYMVGLFEWACIELLRPHLDPGEGSLGTHVDFSHTAATPPGFTLEVTATLTQVDGRSLYFDVRGHDGVDEIGKGIHRRAIVSWERFAPRVAAKAGRLGASG
ncbi:MAG TPA: thioesterase family protein [Polyangiaceae bacterium]|nr:thioesterase family protein [Polyangiaceae bacterium]